MKKLLVLLLMLAFTLCLTACEAKENANGSLGSQITSSETASSENETASTETSSVQSKLNPKTDFKFGKYTTKFYSDDKQSYYEISLLFYKDFEGLEYHKDSYYTAEGCRKKYAGWGMEFNESELPSEDSINLNGVTYYSLGDWEILPESYKMSDTNIKISPDNEKYGTLSLNADGTLVVDAADDDRYSKPGTVYTFVEE
ncbi:MAG: hypothetical protein E7539_05135 [Ruminococcaceae bacterium]|nr:hypothetical protein [Oscillospiraceae bacterium]